MRFYDHNLDGHPRNIPVDHAFWAPTDEHRLPLRWVAVKNRYRIRVPAYIYRIELAYQVGWQVRFHASQAGRGIPGYSAWFRDDDYNRHPVQSLKAARAHLAAVYLSEFLPRVERQRTMVNRRMGLTPGVSLTWRSHSKSKHVLHTRIVIPPFGGPQRALSLYVGTPATVTDSIIADRLRYATAIRSYSLNLVDDGQWALIKGLTMGSAPTFLADAAWRMAIPPIGQEEVFAMDSYRSRVDALQ